MGMGLSHVGGEEDGVGLSSILGYLVEGEGQEDGVGLGLPHNNINIYWSGYRSMTYLYSYLRIPARVIRANGLYLFTDKFHFQNPTSGLTSMAKLFTETALISENLKKIT